jgi:hypothetical protein
MNPICEQWHLPWHALQKDLALGLGTDSLLPPVLAAKSVNVTSAAAATLSWLGRARLRAAPRTPAPAGRAQATAG